MNLTKINFFPSTSILSSFEYNFVNYFLKDINLKILLRLVYYYKIENLKKKHCGNFVEIFTHFHPSGVVIRIYTISITSQNINYDKIIITSKFKS